MVFSFIANLTKYQVVVEDYPVDLFCLNAHAMAVLKICNEAWEELDLAKIEAQKKIEEAQTKIDKMTKVQGKHSKPIKKKSVEGQGPRALPIAKMIVDKVPNVAATRNKNCPRLGRG